MPTRCNTGFYCRSYCLLNMFRASLCPSSGVQEYYTVVAACGIKITSNLLTLFKDYGRLSRSCMLSHCPLTSSVNLDPESLATQSVSKAVGATRKESSHEVSLSLFLSALKGGLALAAVIA